MTPMTSTSVESLPPARLQKAWMSWAGRAVSALPVLGLVMSAAMKLKQDPALVGTFTQHLGFQAGTLPVLGVVELLCVVLYAVPRTAVLGAVLLTGYLGGAIATHVRLGEAFTPPLLLGVLVWAGLFLRDARLRSLLPLRRAP